MADGLPILIEFDSASTAAEVWIKTVSYFLYFVLFCYLLPFYGKYILMQTGCACETAELKYCSVASSGAGNYDSTVRRIFASFVLLWLTLKGVHTPAKKAVAHLL